MGSSREKMIVRYLLSPSSLPSHPSQEGVDVPNSQDAVTLIDADKSNQSMVESLGEEEEKVRVERRERGGRGDGGEGEGREWGIEGKAL